jgi:hypothetical protein
MGSVPTRAGPSGLPSAVARRLHVAVVHSGGEICHVAAALSEAGLAARLGEYVRPNVRP